MFRFTITWLVTNFRFTIRNVNAVSFIFKIGSGAAHTSKITCIAGHINFVHVLELKCQLTY